MATENIIMEAVKRGGDRQDLHEEIRVLSMEAGEQVKKFGNRNDLIDRMIKSEKISLDEKEILEIIDAKKFVGRSSEQVDVFYNEAIKPILEENKDLLGMTVELNV